MKLYQEKEAIRVEYTAVEGGNHHNPKSAVQGNHDQVKADNCTANY